MPTCLLVAEGMGIDRAIMRSLHEVVCGDALLRDRGCRPLVTGVCIVFV